MNQKLKNALDTIELQKDAIAELKYELDEANLALTHATLNKEKKVLMDIVWHSRYGAPFPNIYSCLAKNKDDALEQFWEGKIKDNYEVTSVNIRN